METGLQLLMRDGALRVSFKKPLTVEHYTELLRVVNGSETKRQLETNLRRLVAKWGIEAEVDSILEPKVR